MANVNKTYIVTGNAGFIGSHIVERLLADNHTVIGIDNFETGKPENMSSFIDDERFTFYRKDISNPEHVSDLIALLGYRKQIITGLYAVAARARIQPSIESPARSIECNVNGTFNMLELCRALNIPNFVYSASSSMYGLTNNMPNRIGDPDECLNPYSVSKFIGEKLCITWTKCYGINTVRLRYFNVYGSRSQLEGAYAPVIGIFFRQQLQEKTPLTIVGTGEQKRDFTYISDVVEANIQAMNKCKKLSGGVYNVGTGNSVSINQIAQAVRGETVNTPARPGEARETCASIKETIRDLDWEPTVQIFDGIEKMREHYTELFASEVQE